MGKQKKHKEKKPEEDKNNVAYYKKKNAILEKEEPSEMPSEITSKSFISPMLPVATSTPISKEEEVPEVPEPKKNMVSSCQFWNQGQIERQGEKKNHEDQAGV